MDMETEVPLTGGNMNKVVRIGDTVRRQQGAWSPKIHALLRHLEAKGFQNAPQLLGVDSQNREILSFIPGDVGFLPEMWSESALIAAGVLLRRYHEAAADFVPPKEGDWQFPPLQPEEVICHNDFAPYNLVFRDGVPVALIDFDTARPGPRRWDIALGAYYFAPLSYSEMALATGLVTPDQQAKRLLQFCEACGDNNPAAVIEMVERRLQWFIDSITDRAAAGDAAFMNMLAEGHVQHYQHDLEELRANKQAILKCLEELR